MSNILSEISLYDTIYKLKDDNAVTQEQLEEALANVGNTSVVIQTEAPTDTSVIWIDPDDNNAEELNIVKTVNGVGPDTNGNIQLEIEVNMTEVENHIANKNNPHEVTAEQIGAASIEYVNSLTKVYAQPNEPTNPKEGDIWIDTDAAVVNYAEGVSF